jgi:hypothetical protein
MKNDILTDEQIREIAESSGEGLSDREKVIAIASSMGKLWVLSQKLRRLNLPSLSKALELMAELHSELDATGAGEAKKLESNRSMTPSPSPCTTPAQPSDHSRPG